MATFPSLKPATRTFTLGRHPHSEIPTLSGFQTRVRSSNLLFEQRLRLTFTALTETQMLSIRSHYITQQGRFIPFSIPNDLLSGTASPSSFTPTGYSWIYGNTPQVEDIGLQRYTVTVELIAVPFEGANINGAELTVIISIVGGPPAFNDYGLVTQGVTQSLDYVLVTATVTATQDWGTLT